MKPEDAVPRSPLDKPLHQLTEEDISQLTREDCRRFLRDKGMRRPSWNKSQAIEQVIALKTLLEPRSDSGGNGGFRQKDRTQVHLSQKRNVAVVPVVDNVSDPRKALPKSDILGDSSCRVHDPAHDNHISSPSPRNTNSTSGLVGQMTIFYCGKVSVYDGMPADKAHAIMQLAASQTNAPRDSPPAGIAKIQSIACQIQAPPIRPGHVFPSLSPSMPNVVAENSQQYRDEVALSRETDHEGPMGRKASVQRYLEKRKDRGRFKNKRKIGSSSSLEMYLNHQLRNLNPNDESRQSSGCSPPQPRPPHTPSRCSSVENQGKNIILSIDLNVNDVQEV